MHAVLITRAFVVFDWQTTSGDDVKDFMKQMKNKVTRKYRRKPPKKSYLDYSTTKGSGAGEK